MVERLAYDLMMVKTRDIDVFASYYKSNVEDILVSKYWLMAGFVENYKRIIYTTICNTQIHTTYYTLYIYDQLV